MSLSASNDIARVVDHQLQLERLVLNPNQFDVHGDQIFVRRPSIARIMHQVHTFRVPYHEIWPNGCTDDLKRCAAAQGRSISTTLHMEISMPESLLDVTKVTQVITAIYMHGGGAVRLP